MGLAEVSAATSGSDELDLGPAPRRHPRPSPRQLVLGGTVVVVAAAATGLGVTRPWQHPAPGQLAATGAHCVVGYGTDLVVAAVEVANPSSDSPASVTGIDLGQDVSAVRRVGGPVDSVTAEGCTHVLALRGDRVPAGGRVWLGLTAAVGRCDPTPLPVVVGYDGGRGAHSVVTVVVTLPADAAPGCVTPAP